MAGNPVENKAEAPKVADVLAAVAGVPTPAQAKGVWAAVRQYRKLALLLGGFGILGGAGGYGYKYFTAMPPKANAQADPPAVASKPGEPKPADEPPVVKPALPAKDEAPAVPEVKVPDASMPDLKVPAVKAPTTDTSDTEPPPILPPGPGDQPKKSAADGLPAIAPPPAPAVKAPVDGRKKTADEVKAPIIPAIKAPDADTAKPTVEAPTLPTIQLPDIGKKKPAPEGADPFKATDTVPTDDKPGPILLPTDVNDKKKADGPVIRVQGTDPKVDVPAPTADKKPDVPKIDIGVPPLPDPDKKDDKKADDLPKIAPPPAGKTDDLPTIKIPGPKPDVPPVVVGPMTDKPEVKVPEVKAPEVKSPEIPTIKIPDAGGKPPVADPPKIPPVDIKAGPPPAAPVKKDSYDELWHDDHGEPYAALSREYYHDPKYAAALEAYNKGRRDKIIRVPPPWVLEEKFPHLVGKEKASEARPKDTGLKFEPVGPLPSGRSAPPATETSRPTDEYRVSRESGETVREVAQKVLGDAAAWKKLYELNPNIDPTLPLPAGTILRLK